MLGELAILYGNAVSEDKNFLGMHSQYKSTINDDLFVHLSWSVISII